MAKGLEDVPAGEVANYQQMALIRLLLYVTGEVHRLLGEVVAAGQSILKDGDFDGVAAGRLQKVLLATWDGFIIQYAELIRHGLREGASIPFGMLAVLHEAEIVRALDESVLIGSPGRVFNEQSQVLGGVFEPQLVEIVQAVQARVLGDGLNLSGRIWRLDAEGRLGIGKVIMEALGSGKSAWETAKLLEGFLGVGQDCPRWTEDRLWGLTKKDIAGGDVTGLLKGSDCDGRGVAYNALRLARNEIQIAHHRATDLVMGRMPWVDEEQIHLSPAHPTPDVCDEVIAAGRDGKGIYPKGEIALPLHVQCLCFKSAILMDDDLFVGKLRGWMKGETKWPEMDTYEKMIDGNVETSLLKSAVGVSMAAWLWGGKNWLDALFWQIATSL